MTIRDLEIFIEVVRTKNMSIAAKSLDISQPTVSHAISQIENEYSVKLFDRISKKLYITDIGLRLYHYATSLLEQFEETVIFLQSSSKSYNINLGISSSFGSSYLLEIINEYKEISKNTSIRVYVDSKNEIVEKLEQGVVNLAIIEGDVEIQKINVVDFFHDEIVLVTGSSNDLKDLKEVSLSDLNDQSFVLGELDEVTKKTFLNHLRDKNVDIDINWICQNNDMVLNIIKSTDSVALGSKNFLEDDDLNLIPFKDMKIMRRFNIIYHDDKFFNTQISDFISYLSKKYNKE